jgi:hypothetical protein
MLPVFRVVKTNVKEQWMTFTSYEKHGSTQERRNLDVSGKTKQ